MNAPEDDTMTDEQRFQRAEERFQEFIKHHQPSLKERQAISETMQSAVVGGTAQIEASSLSSSQPSLDPSLVHS